MLIAIGVSRDKLVEYLKTVFLYTRLFAAFGQDAPPPPTDAGKGGPSSEPLDLGVALPQFRSGVQILGVRSAFSTLLLYFVLGTFERAILTTNLAPKYYTVTRLNSKSHSHARLSAMNTKVEFGTLDNNTGTVRSLTTVSYLRLLVLMMCLLSLWPLKSDRNNCLHTLLLHAGITD
jgi:hypothetical protein